MEELVVEVEAVEVEAHEEVVVVAEVEVGLPEEEVEITAVAELAEVSVIQMVHTKMVMHRLLSMDMLFQKVLYMS
jgi:hypothetical protein